MYNIGFILALIGTIATILGFGLVGLPFLLVALTIALGDLYFTSRAAKNIHKN